MVRRKATATSGWNDGATAATYPGPRDRATEGGKRGAAEVGVPGTYEVGPVRRRASRNGAFVFSLTLFVLMAAVVLAAFYAIAGVVNLVALVSAAVVGWLAVSSVHIVLEWEKAVVMRFGRFNRVAGPGLVFTIPVVEFYTLRVDQRVTTTYFSAEETLTSDLVPINVDAVIFWMVWDAHKATVEVEDYSSAVAWIAQTAMRKAIGRASVAEVATRRDQIDEELKEVIEEQLNPWGVTIIDVEIRDIVVPKELQEAMSLEAIAEREKEARMVLAEAEKDISEMLVEASAVMGDDENAMKLRTMHLAYESVKQSGGTLVLPSSFSEGFTSKPGSTK